MRNVPNAEMNQSVSAGIGVESGRVVPLDGVRAIAVLLVICFHIGLTKHSVLLTGGWLGVDVFFVLSGYLITSLLLSESQRTGHISLRRFYLRRFLRLAPLSIGLVAILSLIEVTGLSKSTGLTLPHSGALAVLLYYANWWQLRHLHGLGSLDHTWSLAIEEQFYVVWAGLTVAALAWFRSRRGDGQIVLVVLAAFGAIAMGVVRNRVWNAPAVGANALAATATFLRVYLSSFLRPDGLLWGCLLALAHHRLNRVDRLRVAHRWMRYAGPVGFVACVTFVGLASSRSSRLGDGMMFSWGLSVFNVAVAVVISWLVMAPESIAGQLLSTRPFCWIGQRAYGIYLLQPIIGSLIATRTDLGAAPTSGIVVATTMFVAAISYRFFETPFLRMKQQFSSHATSEFSPITESTGGD